MELCTWDLITALFTQYRVEVTWLKLRGRNSEEARLISDASEGQPYRQLLNNRSSPTRLTSVAMVMKTVLIRTRVTISPSIRPVIFTSLVPATPTDATIRMSSSENLIQPVPGFFTKNSLIAMEA